MRAVLFDLDYTLYDNDQYYLGAFKDIARYFEDKYKITHEKINQFLVNIWKEGAVVYPRVFNDLLEHLNLPYEKIENVIEVFNKHEIDSEDSLYPDVIPVLKKLRSKDYKIGIITDGNLGRQQRKIQKLNLQKLVDDITYTKKTEPKPSTIPFLAALNAMKVEPTSAIYVADNPLIDFTGSKTIGMKTVRIVRGRFSSVPNNDFVDYAVKNLDEVLEILAIN
jgi:putative hydrolase of the HAD superfamily